MCVHGTMYVCVCVRSSPPSIYEVCNRRDTWKWRSSNRILTAWHNMQSNLKHISFGHEMCKVQKICFWSMKNVWRASYRMRAREATSLHSKLWSCSWCVCRLNGWYAVDSGQRIAKRIILSYLWPKSFSVSHTRPPLPFGTNSFPVQFEISNSRPNFNSRTFIKGRDIQRNLSVLISMFLCVCVLVRSLFFVSFSVTRSNQAFVFHAEW